MAAVSPVTNRHVTIEQTSPKHREEAAMAVKVDMEKCNGCGSCVQVCPMDAIKVENDKAVVGDECVECGACVGECPREALSL